MAGSRSSCSRLDTRASPVARLPRPCARPESRGRPRCVVSACHVTLAPRMRVFIPSRRAAPRSGFHVFLGPVPTHGVNAHHTSQGVEVPPRVRGPAEARGAAKEGGLGADAARGTHGRHATLARAPSLAQNCYTSLELSPVTGASRRWRPRTWIGMGRAVPAPVPPAWVSRSRSRWLIVRPRSLPPMHRPCAGDHNYVRASAKFFSVAVRGGGGPVLVLPYSAVGKLPHGYPTVRRRGGGRRRAAGPSG